MYFRNISRCMAAATAAICIISLSMLCANVSLADAVSTPSAASKTQTTATAPKESESYVLVPTAPGTTVYGNDYADIDASNSSEGYVSVKYKGGGTSRIKVLINKQGSNSSYQYNLNTGGAYEVLPFTQGNGTYTVGVYQNVGGSSYALLYSANISVSLRSSTLPFLYPNQYVNFSSASTTVTTGAQISKDTKNDLETVSKVYNYVLGHLSYDYEKAANVKSGYLPSVDSVLNSGAGICFDYAAVMTSMLRTQKIPTKLVVGYAGTIYHAWISTYITDIGWVNNAIYFDGTAWKRMDPTFADNGEQSASIMKYINNGANYNPLYYY